MPFDGLPAPVHGVAGARCVPLAAERTLDELAGLARCRALPYQVRRLAAARVSEEEAERLARAATMDAVAEARAASLRTQGVRAWLGIRLHPPGLDVDAVVGRGDEVLVWER